MQKPKGFDEVQAGGDFERINLGGHRCVIMNVAEQTNRNGGQMIVVSLDFDSSDKQLGYMKKQYQNDTRNPKKWPASGTQYINVYDSEGKTSKSFKGFCTAFEDSNGAKVQWIDNFGAQFKGRSIGAVYGEEESFYDGKVHTQHKIRWFCNYQTAEDQRIPDKREYQGGTGQTSSPSSKYETNEDGFMSIPDGVEDEGLPFA